MTIATIILIILCVLSVVFMFLRMMKKNKSKTNVQSQSINKMIDDIKQKTENTSDIQQLKILYNTIFQIKKKYAKRKESADADVVLKFIQNKTDMLLRNTK